METIMKYYYIGKDNSGRYKLPEVEFEAIRYKDDNGEYRLSPIDKNSWQYDGKKHFIRGKGYVKIGKKNKIIIPVFDNIAEHWNDYLSKYGAECLFYSISGKELNSPDCCDIPEITEFNSINYGGAEKYSYFAEQFTKMVDLQREIVKEKYSKIGFGTDFWVNKVLFRPTFYLLYTFIPTKYAVDVVKDDDKMMNFYKDIRVYELQHKDPRYKEYECLTKQYQELLDEPNKDYWKLETLRDETTKLYNNIHADARNQAIKETETDNDVFPTSVKDRIYFLFGKEIGDIYNDLVDNYVG